MRTDQKKFSLEYFCQLSLTKEEFFALILRIHRDREAIEIKVGDTIFEGIEEIRSHHRSITFPMELTVGTIQIEFDSSFRNRISSVPADSVRVQSIIRELEAFKNPLERFSKFLPSMALLSFIWLCLLVVYWFAKSLIGFHVPTHVSGWIPYVLMPLAIYLSYKIEKRGLNRFVSGSGSFVAKYADKIVPSVVSSLLTAALIWIVANWAAVKSFFDGTSP